MSDLPPEELVKALRRGAADADEIAQKIVDSASAVGAAGSYHGCQARADYSGAMRQAAALIERLEAENARAWRERNVAYAKVKAWETTVFVEGLPLRAVQVDEWGPGEGETVTIPHVTPQKLTDLLDELAALRKASKYLAQGEG